MNGWKYVAPWYRAGHEWRISIPRIFVLFSAEHCAQVLICSIKREVKKKHFRIGWSFSCFTAHLIELDLFLTSAPGARLPATLAQRFGFSLPAVFIAYSQRSRSVPKPTKQNGGQIW